MLYSPLRSSHEFREALAESGASVASASMKRSIGLSVLKELSHVRSWLRAIGPLDVLHAHSTKAGLLLRALPPRAANARLYSPHAYRSLDVSLPRAARKAAQILEVRLLGGAGIWTIAVGDLEYEHAAAVLGRDPRLRLVRNGLLPRPGRSVLARRSRRSDKRRVVWAGRLVAQKDPLLFVETIRAAPALDGGVDVMMVGDGPLAAEVDAAVGSGPARQVRRGWTTCPNSSVRRMYLSSPAGTRLRPIYSSAAAAGAWILTLMGGGGTRHYER